MKKTWFKKLRNDRNGMIPEFTSYRFDSSKSLFSVQFVTIEESEPPVVCIIDRSIESDRGYRSVTNNAENVVCDIAACYNIDLDNEIIIYRDTRNAWDIIRAHRVGDFSYEIEFKYLDASIQKESVERAARYAYKLFKFTHHE